MVEVAEPLMILKSKRFSNKSEMPKLYTCEGQNISPHLEWDNIPDGTESLALIVEDPDAPDPRAPKRVFTHWIIYNIPPTTFDLAEGISNFPEGLRMGLNDWGEAKWGGPCPPIGKHRYFHNLYALNCKLNFQTPPTKAQILEQMKNHVLGKAELIGLYEKTSSH